MGLLNNLPTLSKNFLGGNVSSGFKKDFRDTLRLGDFMTSDVEVKAGKWIPVGEYKVGSRQVVNAGFGDVNHPEEAGYIYAKFKDTDGNVVDGKFRIVAKDINDQGKDVMFSEDLDSLSGDLNDKSKMTMLPKHPTEVVHEELLVLEIMADTDATIKVSDTETKLKLPIARRYTN